MRHYTHLTAREREVIMCLVGAGESITAIAVEVGRDKSTVSRELARNRDEGGYSAAVACEKYRDRRSRCGRGKILDDPAAYEIVRSKFLEEQWSPEQIEGRLKLEGSAIRVSDTTIYRAIWAGRFDGELPGWKKASRKLRHRGKRRHKKGEQERRGRIVVSHDIGERPREAEERSRLGDWEADTVAGKPNGACLVTLVDRKSRLLVGGKTKFKRSREVNGVMERSLAGQPLESVTPDRGKEFAAHAEVTNKLGVEFYFALPHHPWQRGTNENTNGLLREYFPKGTPFEEASDESIAEVYDKLNRRPRKTLGFKTPYEVHYSASLQLI